MSNKSLKVATAPEPKVHRSVQEIQQEYSQVCMKAGHAQYQLFTIQRDLDALNDTLRSLNIEAAQAKAAADAEAAKPTGEEVQANV